MFQKMSERTEMLKNRLFWLRFIVFLLLATPIFYFFVVALASNAGSIKKVGLITSVLIGIGFIAINFMLKFHLRSPLYIIAFGIHLVLDDIQVLLLLLAITSVLDELIFTPWIKRTKIQLISNKEMDKRL